MKKERFIITLALMMALLIFAPTVLAVEGQEISGTCGDNLTWTLDADAGTLTIAGTGAMQDYSADSLPPWFEYRQNIRTAVISNDVTRIGDYAFYYCTGLTSVLGGAGTYEIGSFAFARSSVNRFTAGTNAVTIGEKAFSYCTELSYVDISTVRNIASSAFEHCGKLKNVVFGNNLTQIGNYAFYCCETLEKVSLEGDNIFIGNYAFSRSGVVELTLSGVTEIGKGGFNLCRSLTDFTMPSTVALIGDRAFTGCDMLEAISFNGTAPSVTRASSDDRSFDDIVLYFYLGKDGWTSPQWHGYNTRCIRILGDLDGDGALSNNDLVILARFMVNLEEFSDEQLVAADLDCDGEVINTDLVNLARILVS